MHRIRIMYVPSSAAAALALTPRGGAAQGLPKVAYQEYRLDNGLRVILATRPGSSVVAVDLTYDVGSRNDRRPTTAVAVGTRSGSCAVCERAATATARTSTASYTRE